MGWEPGEAHLWCLKHLCFPREAWESLSSSQPGAPLRITPNLGWRGWEELFWWVGNTAEPPAGRVVCRRQGNALGAHLGEEVSNVAQQVTKYRGSKGRKGLLSLPGQEHPLHVLPGGIVAQWDV